ncbi:MAG: alkaline shock response membrane anchor protein AmaP [Actinobacteria bacterium]|nr:alkaline shock response membrane anchor protein AmaP [Actinomycetota bacterium]
MGIIDRIVLMIYTLLLAAISGVLVAMSLTSWLDPVEWIRTSLSEGHNGRLVIGVTGAAFLLASLRFIWYVFTPAYPRRTMVHETDLGEIHVTLDAIENLVKRTAKGIRGVRDVRAKVVNAEGGGVRVYLRAVVSPDVSVPQVSAEIQSTLKNFVKNVVGVAVNEVKIHVENITTESRRARVE